MRSFTWRDVMEDIMEKTGIWIDKSIIRKIFKEELGYSFKRCSSRPFTLNHKALKLKKALFTIKLLKMINQGSIIINVDEWVFSQSTKPNYSWSKVGVPSNRSTEIVKGSISIVSSITSNGVSITAIRKGTITSSSFIKYIGHLFSIWRRL